MESRLIDSYPFTYYQFLIFRYARPCSITRNFTEIHTACHNCRLGCTTFRISIPVLIGVVLIYQAVGTLGEWIYNGNFYSAIQDFRIGIPGMCLQVLGGYTFIKYLIRK